MYQLITHKYKYCSCGVISVLRPNSQITQKGCFVTQNIHLDKSLKMLLYI